MADVTYGQLAEYAISVVGFNAVLKDEERNKYVQAADRAVRDIYTAIAPYCDWSWSFRYKDAPGEEKKGEPFSMDLGKVDILGGTEPRVVIISEESFSTQFPLYRLGREEFLRNSKEIYKNASRGGYPECYGIYAMNGHKSLSGLILKDGWAQISKLYEPAIGVLYVPDYPSCFEDTLPDDWDFDLSEVESARAKNLGTAELMDKIIPLPDEYHSLAYSGAASYSRLIMPSMAKSEIDAELRVKFETGLRDAVQVAQERYFGNKRIRCHGF